MVNYASLVGLWSALSLSTASAWVTTSSSRSSSGHCWDSKRTAAVPTSSSRTTFATTTTTTQLYMFDWFNPKPKPTNGETSAKTEKTTKPEAGGDFLGNLFNQDQAAAEPAAAPVEDKEKAVEAPKAVAVEEKPAVVEKAAVEEKTVAEPKATTAKEVETAPSATTTTTTATTPPPPKDEIRHRGQVRWFDRKRGYGLIDPTDEEGSKIHKNEKTQRNDPRFTVFVHQSDIQAEGYRFLFDGEFVEFGEIMDDKGRKKATHVTGPDAGDLRITQVRKRDKEREQAAGAGGAPKGKK